MVGGVVGGAGSITGRLQCDDVGRVGARLEQTRLELSGKIDKLRAVQQAALAAQRARLLSRCHSPTCRRRSRLTQRAS